MPKTAGGLRDYPPGERSMLYGRWVSSHEPSPLVTASVFLLSHAGRAGVSCAVERAPWAAPTTFANSVFMNGHIEATLSQLPSAPSASPSGDKKAILALLC